MKRNFLAAVVGLVVAPLILCLGVFLQLRFTSFGDFIRTANNGSTEQLIQEFGDPIEATARFAQINRWLISPVAALISAMAARLIAGRSTLAMSLVVILPIAAMNIVWIFGFAGFAATAMYVLVAWLGMKCIDSFWRTAANAS